MIYINSFLAIFKRFYFTTFQIQFLFPVTAYCWVKPKVLNHKKTSKSLFVFAVVLAMFFC